MNRPTRVAQTTALLAVLTFLLAACDSSLGFLGKPYADQYYTVSLYADDEADPDGIPVEPGSVLIPGGAFTVTVDPLPGSPAFTHVAISLIAQEAVTAQAVYAIEGAPEPKGHASLGSSKTSVSTLSGVDLPVVIPAEMAQGLYRLRIELFGQDGPVYDKEHLVFVSTAALSIASIQVSPATIEPGSVAVLRAQLEVSSGVDPYLVWIHDDEVIDEGLLSNGKANIAWKAPGDEGVYSLNLRAYPYPPRNGQAFDFPGAASLSARVIVRKAELDLTDPFQPQNDFIAQFRFNGSLADTGSRHSRAPSRAAGAPGVFVYGSGYGIRFDPSASLVTDEYLLPVENGVLEPFSLMGRLLVLPEGADDELPVARIASLRVPASSGSSASFLGAGLLANDVGGGDSLGASSSASGGSSSVTAAMIEDEASASFSWPGRRPAGTVFRSESSIPGFGLELAISGEGQFVLNVSNRAEKVVFESGIYPDDRIHDLVVSVVPDADGLSVSWFWDYISVTSARMPIRIGTLPETGRASFGGEGAASVVLDEFGVYSRAGDGGREPWSGAFATLMRRTIRRGLVYAEGFDGIRVPATGVRGAASMEKGVLLLGAGSSIELPFPRDARGSYEIDIAFRVIADSLKNRAFAIVAAVDGREIFRIGQDGRFTAEGAEPGRASGVLSGQSIKVRIGRDAKGYFFMNGGQRVLLAGGPDAAIAFSLVSAKSVLPVEFVLISSKDVSNADS